MSAAMRMVEMVLRVKPRMPRDVAGLAAECQGRDAPVPAQLPEKLARQVQVRRDVVEGCPVVTLAPLAGGSGRHVIYTHGGAYVYEIQGPHWDIAGALVQQAGATVTVPVYPLAPEHQYGAGYRLLEAVYRGLLATVPAERIVLAGDSAGGGLALGQVYHAREAGLPQPGRVVLFSPWLDVTLADPEARRLEASDPLLRVDVLRQAGAWWAGDADPRNPVISPLYGDPAGLPPVDIYQGTHDILLADARTLRDRIGAAAGSVAYHETPKGVHGFMGVTFLPEAREVFRVVAASLEE